MTNLDSLQYKSKQSKPSQPKPNQSQTTHPEPREYDMFHETLAPTLPGLADYYSDDHRASDETEIHSNIEAKSVPMATSYQRPSTGRSIMQIVTAVLGLMLGVRFIVSLITFDHTTAPLNVLYGASNWLVAPLQGLLSQTPIMGLGLIEWGTFATLVAIILIGRFLGRLAWATGM